MIKLSFETKTDFNIVKNILTVNAVPFRIVGNSYEIPKIRVNNGRVSMVRLLLDTYMIEGVFLTVVIFLLLQKRQKTLH